MSRRRSTCILYTIYSPAMPIKWRILVFGAWFFHEPWQFRWLGCTQNTHIGWYTVEPQKDWELRGSSILELLGWWFRIVFGRSAGSNKLYSCISQTCWKRSSMFDPLPNHFFSGMGCKKTLSTKKKTRKTTDVSMCANAACPFVTTWPLEVLKKLLEWRADLSRADSSGKRLVLWLWGVFVTIHVWQTDFFWILDWLQ